MTIRGKCYCGAVEIEISEPSQNQLYCHCQSCRSWTGQQVMTGAVFSGDAVRFLSGEANVRRFKITDTQKLERLSCEQCGAAIGTCVSVLNIYDICVGILQDFVFKPAMHINYQERKVSMPDGLPKFRDFPRSIGGTGEKIEE